MKVLAFDLGGTRLKAGLVLDRRVARSIAVDAPANGSRDALREVLGLVGRQVLDGAACDGAGLCVPGVVDERGVVQSLPGKLEGIEGVDLPALLRDTFGVRAAAVQNDAIAYAMGEAVAGAGRGCGRVVVVTIGTGIGVTVIQDGAPAPHNAGIFGGFIPISERTDGVVDSIGRSDTIEALCAAPRIAEACDTATVADAYAAAANGEPGARDGLRAYQAHLARALVALAHAHAPDRIVLGGGPMTPDNPITPGLEQIVNARLFGRYRITLRTAELGDTAALVGLAHLVESS